MTSGALRVCDLSVSYGRRTTDPLRVLNDITLDFPGAGFTSVVGPSGCGKTTLLMAMMGLIEPAGGRVVRDTGSDASTSPRSGSARAPLGLAFQRPQLLPWRSTLENVLFGVECRGASDAAAHDRARALLTRMRLGDHLNDYPHQLSEGMKQRVNLARALMVEPSFLLLDEPFAALDEHTRRLLQDDLLELWSEGPFGIVLVSHSLEEVVYLSDRVVVLSDKPTTVKHQMPVDLARPRATDAAGRRKLFECVERLRTLL